MSLCDHLNVDWRGIVGSAVACHLVSWLWYSDALFGKQFKTYCPQFTKKEEEKEAAVAEESAKPSGSELAVPLLGTFATNTLRAFVVTGLTKEALQLAKRSCITITSLRAGLHSAVVGFLGFVLPTRLSAVFWGGQPLGLFSIFAGQELVTLLLTGAIVGYFAK